MLWLLEEHEMYRIYHCDLCGEDSLVNSFSKVRRGYQWTLLPYNRGDPQVRTQRLDLDSDYWKYCGCEKGWGRWATWPAWKAHEPKLPHEPIYWCTDCDGYIGPDRELRWLERTRGHFCKACYKTRKTLRDCERGLKILKKEIAEAKL